MKNSDKPIISPFLKNKETIKESAVLSLRSSFEVEGIYFTDDKIKSMVKRVRTPKAPRK